MIAIFALGMVYVLLKVYLEKRWAPLDDIGPDRHLADLAFACGDSVFGLFQSAGARWNFSEQKIDADFKSYLQSGHVPPYVSDYARQHPFHRNRTYHHLIHSGGRPPYL
jgi:hypothetical protein